MVTKLPKSSRSVVDNVQNPEKAKVGPYDRYKWSYGAPRKSLLNRKLGLYYTSRSYFTPFITIVGAHLVIDLII